MTTAGTSSVGGPALDALYEIAVLAAGGRNDPAAVAELTASHACRLLGVEAAALFAWNAKTGLLHPVFETPSSAKEGPMRPGEGMVGRVFEAQAPLKAADYQSFDGGFASSRDRGMGGAVAVPMIVSGRPVGVLGVWSYQPRDFSDEEVQLLGLFAAHVAPGFEATRLAAERDFHDRALHALHEVAMVAASTNEPHAVADAACARARDLLGSDTAYVSWYEPEHDVLRVMATTGRVANRPGWTTKPGGGVSGVAFQRREPVSVEDFPNWPQKLDWLVAEGIQSMVAVPLMVRDRAVGAMALGWIATRHLEPADLEALTLLAAQVAGDLENLSLLDLREQQVRGLTALQEIAVATSGVLDAAALARLAVERAREMLGVESAVLRWWDPDRGTLRLLASNDPNPDQHVLDVSPHQGVVGVAFRTRRHAIIENYQRSESGLPWAAKDGVATALGVPLMVGPQPVGALAVATYRPHTYDAEQIRLLQLLAAQLAPALEAARLAEEREHHLHTVSVLSRVAAAAGGALVEAEVARLTIDAAAELFEGGTAGIAMWDPVKKGLTVLWDHDQSSDRRLSKGDGQVAQAFYSGETVVVDDYPNWEHATERTRALGVKAGIAVPLLSGDRPVGALGVRFFTERQFTPADVQLVQLLAAQVAPSLSAARLHADLARSERMARGLHEAMASGFVVFDRHGKVIDINDAALRIFGVERSSLRGRAPSEVAGVTPITREAQVRRESERPFRRAMTTRKPVHGAVMGYRRPDGSEFWLQHDAVPVFDADGQIDKVIGTFIDITSVKTADEAKRESEAKSRFLASMSHELRTPLNSILGFAQLLDQQAFGGLNDRQHRYVGHINASGLHLLELVNDILDLSKVAAGQMDIHFEDVPVHPALAEVLGRLRPLADERDLTLTHAINEGLVARADRRRLEQVLYNLLSNAIKFTPKGGSVAVEARRRAGQVVISVRDTGLGIPEDQQARIFEEFTQADDGRSRRHEGTGLGLPLSRRLVELMGGRLALHSKPGRGSEFSFTLPVA